MNIINNNMIDFKKLSTSIKQPEIFEKGNDKFWDDEYISNQMLKYHLNPDVEAASKTWSTISAESAFIIATTDMKQGKKVLDLGCGPGLYVREFAKTGADITGVDMSKNSIEYAMDNIASEYANAGFLVKNYLDLDFALCFDVATLIFYDFCALNTLEQETLLTKVHDSLNDNGLFIFDVVSDKKKTTISTNITVCDEGFWSPKPYIEILNTYLYESPKTEGIQYTLIDELGKTRIIRIYHRLFALSEIQDMLIKNGFEIVDVYRNLKGELLDEGSETFGIIARKI